MSQDIQQKVSQIKALEDVVREHINTHRYQKDLISDSANWNQICCSLDTIDDTSYAISSYFESDYPAKSGLAYIFTYGLLQALFVQQGAIAHLSEAFGIEYKPSSMLWKIRDIRNGAIGHPTKQTRKQESTLYNYIGRMTLSQHGFELMRCSADDKTTFERVQFLEIVENQLNEILYAYGAIADKLKKEDEMHKDKYKDELLVSIFHSSMNYNFQKIASGIHSPDFGNKSFALTMLGSVQKTYQEFEDALQSRGDMNEYIQYDLNEYKHALSRLESYLKAEGNGMTEQDALIYCFYIKETHKIFEQIAKEIDEDYRS